MAIIGSYTSTYTGEQVDEGIALAQQALTVNDVVSTLGQATDKAISQQAFTNSYQYAVKSFATMPTPTVDYLNTVAFYIGTTTAQFTQSHIYECQQISSGVYQWVDITSQSQGAVESVNGQTGVVVLTASDVGASSTAELQAETTARTNADNTLQANINLKANNSYTNSITPTANTIPTALDDLYLKNEELTQEIIDLDIVVDETTSSEQIVLPNTPVSTIEPNDYNVILDHKRLYSGELYPESAITDGTIPSPTSDAPIPIVPTGNTAKVNIGSWNLLPISPNFFGTRSGVTFTQNSDGSVKVTGTATATFFRTICNTSSDADPSHGLKPLSTISLNSAELSLSNGSLPYYGIEIFYSDGTSESLSSYNKSYWTKSLTKDVSVKNIYSGISITSGNVCDFTFYPMLVVGNKVLTANDWQPYTAPTTVTFNYTAIDTTQQSLIDNTIAINESASEVYTENGQSFVRVTTAKATANVTDAIPNSYYYSTTRAGFGTALGTGTITVPSGSEVYYQLATPIVVPIQPLTTYITTIANGTMLTAIDIGTTNSASLLDFTSLIVKNAPKTYGALKDSKNNVIVPYTQSNMCYDTIRGQYVSDIISTINARVALKADNAYTNTTTPTANTVPLALTDIYSQIGNIGTALNTINGEVI